MAQEVAIPGSPAMAKIRNPLGVLGLSIITLGIYSIFWWYYVNKEMAELGAATGDPELGDSPVTSVLAVTIGGFIIVPPFVSLYNTAKRIGLTQEKTVGTGSISPVLMLVLTLLLITSIFVMPLMQMNLNQAWEKGAQAKRS